VRDGAWGRVVLLVLVLVLPLALALALLLLRSETVGRRGFCCGGL
jgi:hypothetical protein